MVSVLVVRVILNFKSHAGDCRQHMERKGIVAGKKSQVAQRKNSYIKARVTDVYKIRYEKVVSINIFKRSLPGLKDRP